MRSVRTTLMLVGLLLAIVAGSASVASAREAALDVNSCGVDEFTGEALDSARWTVLRPGPAGSLGVTGGQLRLRALTGDLYGDRDTAQNVVLQSTPTGAWTATAQFDTSALTAEGQQSGIVVRKDGSNFSKFVFINKGSGSRRFEHIYTAGKVGRLSDADFTAALPTDFPGVVKIRVISDGNTIRGEYANGNAWVPIGRPAAIGGPAQVGVYAADNAADGPTVPYDSFSLNAQSEEFAGTELESCRWSSIVRPNAAGYRVANGALELDAGSGEVNTTAPNLIGQPVPAGDWEVETKVDLTTTAQGQQAGLLLYRANDNWIKAVLVRTGNTTAQIEFVRVKDGGYQLDAPFKVDVQPTLTSFHLRMRASGTLASAQYSTNGTTWTEVGKARDIADLATGQIGPMALRGGAGQSVTAKFDYFRVRPAAINIFTTIGITREATRNNSAINGNPPYSLPGEEMPPSRTVGTAPNDTNDVVPLRMPDTTGNVPNLAMFSGQTLPLLTNDQKPYSRLHFFGTTADGSGGGEFTLTYQAANGTNVTRQLDVSFPDWCGSPTEAAHIAIGPMTKRWRANNGQDGAPCSIYHVALDNPEPTLKLLSVTLPPNTGGGGTATRAYLMALTLEDANGDFELPDLSGLNQFPDDDQAPESDIEIDPATPSGQNGWHNAAPLVEITHEDTGGSGVEQVQYRINGGTPQFYTQPFRLTAEGDIKLEYRSIDRAGNAESFESIQVKVDATAPSTSASTFPEEVLEGGWHDREVTVGLRAEDGLGSGAARTEYRINPADANAPWVAYTAAFDVSQAGTNTVEYRSVDAAGNEEAARSVSVRVDVTAPTTAVRLNGGEPAATYTGAVRVTFTRDDGAGAGADATEYRVDGGDWTPYEGFFDVAGNSGHRVDFRSSDLAGNVENFKTVMFTIRPTSQLPAPVQQAQPAPAPKPYAAVEEVSSRLRTLPSLRAGQLKVYVSCAGVSRGTLTLTVDRAVVRKLKLKTATLASKVLRCGEEGRATVSLRPSSAVRKALARSKTSVKAKLTLRMTGAATDTQTVTFRGKS